MITIGERKRLVVDIHGHLTTEDLAATMQTFHKALLAADGDPMRLRAVKVPVITDETIRQSVGDKQVGRMDKRGVDVTFFSPRASAMRPDLGSPEVSEIWTRESNNLIHRITELFSGRFIGVGQLPQSPGTSMDASIKEMDRCVNELGFVGFNLNPDSSGGKRAEPILSDEYWHPAYRKAVELGVPFMAHVSGVCKDYAYDEKKGNNGKVIHSTGEAYLHADISAFVNLIELSSKQDGKLFTGDLETLKFILPHGGGGVVQHWGRFEGMLQDNDRLPLAKALKNVFFDTCVYWRPGMECLFQTVNPQNLLFGSETVGALRAKAIDPDSGEHRDHTKYLIETLLIPDRSDRTRNVPLSDEVKAQVFAENVVLVYPRAGKQIQALAAQLG